MATTNTWSTYVYTAHPGFQRAFGREADRRRKLFNGPLEAQYYQYLGKRSAAEGDSADSSTESREP